jgi:hypothetical protein
LQKFILDEGESIVVITTSNVLLKTGIQVNSLNLLLKKVPLVEEQDHCRISKPSAVANFFEKFQGFVHTVGLCKKSTT